MCEESVIHNPVKIEPLLKIQLNLIRGVIYSCIKFQIWLSQQILKLFTQECALYSNQLRKSLGPRSMEKLSMVIETIKSGA